MQGIIIILLQQIERRFIIGLTRDQNIPHRDVFLCLHEPTVTRCRRWEPFIRIIPHICHFIYTGILCGWNILHPKRIICDKLNLRQNNVNRSNALCKMIRCGKIPIYCAKSPIQCKITCCGQNCTQNVLLHRENHTLSCTFCVNYTTFVKYMDHFHVQSRKFYTWQKKFTQAPPVTNMRYEFPPSNFVYASKNFTGIENT